MRLRPPDCTVLKPAGRVAVSTPSVFFASSSEKRELKESVTDISAHHLDSGRKLTTLWSEFDGALQGSTLEYLSKRTWTHLWRYPQYHSLLKDIVCYHPSLLSPLIHSVACVAEQPYRHRDEALRLFDLIFSEIGHLPSSFVISKVLKPLNLYRQLCPPEVWSCDFLRQTPLTKSVAEKLILILSVGPHNRQFLRMLCNFCHTNNDVSSDLLLPFAAAGAFLERKAISNLITGDAQKRAMVAWIAYNNGHEDLVATCLPSLVGKKSTGELVRDAVVTCGWPSQSCTPTSGCAQFLLTLVHAAPPFGCPKAAGLVFSECLRGCEESKTSRKAALTVMGHLVLSLEPREFSDLFLSLVESQSVSKTMVNKLRTHLHTCEFLLCYGSTFCIGYGGRVFLPYSDRKEARTLNK